MPYTLSEIAKAAGVSQSVVSKVLHNAKTSVRVSDLRATQIRRIAEEMGYVPNSLARSLRTTKTQTIGVVFQDLAGIGQGLLYITYLLEGISQVAFPEYRITMIAHVDPIKASEALWDGRVDGVIWCHLVRDEETEARMRKAAIPIVALAAPSKLEVENTTFVRCDNEEGMRLAVEHLHGLGHRKFLFVRERQEETTSDCVDRLDGVKRALEDLGCPLGQDDVKSWSWDLNEFENWWQSAPPNTAIVCWTERCAGAFLRQCERFGVAVPERLSVVGFDSTHFCEATRPRLTAVRQPVVEMASFATQTLLDRISGLVPSQRTYSFPCSLDIRESTARPFDLTGPRSPQRNQ